MKTCASVPELVNRSEFNVTKTLLSRFALDQSKEFLHVGLGVDEWIAVIGERKRHQPLSREPAVDARKHNCVPQIRSRRRCGICNGLIPIGSAKGLQPGSSVEYGSERMLFHKGIPSRIRKRLDRMDSFLRTFRNRNSFRPGPYGMRNRQGRSQD